jgi:hypothetical protein
MVIICLCISQVYEILVISVYNFMQNQNTFRKNHSIFPKANNIHKYGSMS